MKINEYFGGDVTSIAFENSEGRATVGVMAVGEYEFGTTETERFKVVSGELQIRQPDQSEFTSYRTGTEFCVASGVKFAVKVQRPTAYLCFYGE